MAKWYGVIGFAETKETAPGVWKEQITERNYYGDVSQLRRRSQSSDGVNDNIIISNVISIMSEPFVDTHCDVMRYVEFMGAKWKVADVQVEYPRLKLTLGGVYNG